LKNRPDVRVALVIDSFECKFSSLTVQFTPHSL
jgi:hypothetical protein